MALRGAFALFLTALAAAATYAVLIALGPDWTIFAPATCLATHCFCEIPRTGQTILQPANSWSSLSFVFVGLWVMLAAGQRNGRSPFCGFAAIWFGLTGIVIGLGSFLLHATLTLWGQFGDVLGMYLFSAFTLAYAFKRWRGLSETVSAAIYLGICAILIGLLIVIPETRRWMFAVVIVADIIVELWLARPRRPRVQAHWYIWGIVLQAIAFTIWILDQTGKVCSGSSLIQGHAVWHVLNAAALFTSYLYYRSERRFR